MLNVYLIQVDYILDIVRKIMKIGIVGSRNLQITDLTPFLPPSCCEIVTGGAKGIDACAMQYAKERNVPLTVFMPQYEKFGKAAPLVRNREIVHYSDRVLAFWDGKSRGTKFVIDYCQEVGKPCELIRCFPEQNEGEP
jgi:hypothetical protein